MRATGPAAWTWMPAWLPAVNPAEDAVSVKVPRLVNVAVNVCRPASAAVNGCRPASGAVNVYAGGRVGAPPVALNVTVPVKPVATFPSGSRAVTVNVPARPVGRNAGKSDTASRLATPVAAGRARARTPA